jgi:hypothetical protein
MTTQRVLDYYTRITPMTHHERAAGAFDSLPADLPGLARVIQGQLLHEHWARAYGETLSDERRMQSHVRSVDDMLTAILARNPAPLTTARSTRDRQIGVCRHFSVLLVAMLRERGIPARARCGFGAYFEPGKLVDHWVCEYWDTAARCWRLVDAQIDALQRDVVKPTFDLMDVPRDQFVIAGDAWVKSREGMLDPNTCGIMDMYGLWFIGGNVLRDFASLNHVEMLPWDVWGAMPEPDESMGSQKIALYDRLAALTRAPDERFDELRTLYEQDERLRVPKTIFNAVLNREEAV